MAFSTEDSPKSAIQARPDGVTRILIYALDQAKMAFDTHIYYTLPLNLRALLFVRADIRAHSPHPISMYMIPQSQKITRDNCTHEWETICVRWFSS
jgi:hypothetical protein